MFDLPKSNFLVSKQNQEDSEITRVRRDGEEMEGSRRGEEGKRRRRGRGGTGEGEERERRRKRGRERGREKGGRREGKRWREMNTEHIGLLFFSFFLQVPQNSESIENPDNYFSECKNSTDPLLFLKTAEYYFSRGEEDLGVTVLSSVTELDLQNPHLIR
jgi:hypothetical protein